jgi:ParB-like chromosome segregation protein Spo0J
MTLLKISDLTLDHEDVQIRIGTDKATVERYAENFDKMPPVTAYLVDGEHVLSDGFHRVAAALSLGHDSIEVNVISGTLEEASVAAITANVQHGLQLTTEEFERGVLRLEKKGFSLAEIGKAMNRSERYVGDILQANEYTISVSTDSGPAVGPSGYIQPLSVTHREAITRAPKEVWKELGEAAIEKHWTSDKIREVAKVAKTDPERAKSLMEPVVLPSESKDTPFDMITPLLNGITTFNRLVEHPERYPFSSGGPFSSQVLTSLYVLWPNIAEMIVHLETISGNAPPESVLKVAASRSNE